MSERYFSILQGEGQSVGASPQHESFFGLNFGDPQIKTRSELGPPE
jgi:hypothetical protein